MNSYAIDDEQGKRLACGLSAREAPLAAQRAADRLGKPVFWYAEMGSRIDEDPPRHYIEVLPSSHNVC